jgi:hypothetical protein
MKFGDLVKVVNTRSAFFGYEGMVERVDGVVITVQLKNHRLMETFEEDELKLITKYYVPEF